MAAWKAPVREGFVFNHYIDFDFRTVARINKIKVGTSDTVGGVAVRFATVVAVTYSLVRDFVENTVIKADVSEDNEIDLGGAIETRYLRITVLETSGTPPDTAPLAINQ